MNPDAFRYIIENRLWNQQGQIDWFNKGMPVSFPSAAIEIKADWKDITPADKPRYHWNVTGKNKDELVGLVALHVTTKDLPNWFWATFEHVDNKFRCEGHGCSDTFGLDAQKNPSLQLLDFLRDNEMGSEWTYYRLTGSQIDFTTSTGTKTHLGNSVIEGRNGKPSGFMECSSCITCHSESRMNRDGFQKSYEPVAGDPDPAWFTGPPQKMQMDFVWSLSEAWAQPSQSCSCPKPSQ